MTRSLLNMTGFLFVGFCVGCGSGSDSGSNASGGTTGHAGSSSGGSSSGGASSGGTSSGGTNTSGSGGTAAAGGASAGTSSSGGSGTGGGKPLADCNGPALTTGTWIEITPPGLDLTSEADHSYGVNDVALDPNDPCVLYATVDMRGTFKTEDAGATWTRLGTPGTSPESPTTFLDSPLHLRIDPTDSQHLYVVQGVRGATLGFWISTDGGASFTRPASFDEGASTTWTNDGYWISTDPTDFQHVLMAFHSPWKSDTAGVIESTDGGETWTPHASNGGWGGGGIAVNFLYDTVNAQGDSKTWLLGTQAGDGYYRTSDGGGTWTSVTTHPMMHGGTNIYYAKNGTLYSGANNQIMRSTDNGLTFTLVGDSFQDGYYTVIGDGNFLYAQEANTGANSLGAPQPYIVSPEDDGTTWSAYSTQTFSDGPFAMVFDAQNRVIYSANWQAGVWALKVD